MLLCFFGFGDFFVQAAMADVEATEATEAAQAPDLVIMEKIHKTQAANADAFFLIAMGIVIFFMQGGFAFLEAGSVR